MNNDTLAREFEACKDQLKSYIVYVLLPLMEALGLAEVTHDKRGNKMRAV